MQHNAKPSKWFTGGGEGRGGGVRSDHSRYKEKGSLELTGCRAQGTSSSSMLLWCWRGCLGHDSVGMKLKENPTVHFQTFS